jgi:hypothetical protein
MDVIGHDGKGQDIESVACRDPFEALLQPCASVFIGLARDRVLAAQPSAPDCALDAVIDSNFVGIKEIASILPSHREIPPKGRRLEGND